MTSMKTPPPDITPTPEQVAVVEAATTERTLIIAGPGTGKTQVAAQRLAHLLSQGLRPSAILVLSFSRSAVATLTRRLAGLSAQNDAILEELRHVAIRTFDSWTFRLLRQLGFDPTELLRRTHDDNVDELIAVMRSSRRGEVQNLLVKVRHVLVDEMQDLAGVRGDLIMELLELVAPRGHPGVGFTLLGDPAQSIFGFSVRQSGRTSLHGETTDALLDSLRRGWTGELREVLLDRNHRSGPEIASVIDSLRHVLRQRIDPAQKLQRVARALNDQPVAGFELGPQILDLGQFESVGILTRTNGEALRVTQKMLGQGVDGPGVPITVGGSDDTGAPAWVAALLGCIRAATVTRPQFDAVVNRARSEAPDAFEALSVPETAIAWRRLVAAAGEPIDSASLRVKELSRRLNWADTFPDDESIPTSGLFVSTIHQSKGREFDLVAILEHEQLQGEGREVDSGEEACVGFVALSRAVRQLVRLPADSVYQPPSPKRFADGIRTRLLHWRNGWVNLEMGLKGDIDPASFADVVLLGGEEAAVDNYRFLAANASVLVGHKVMLRKAAIPGSDGDKKRYEICLQDGRQPGRLLGAMGQNVVWDLLGVLHRHGYGLPRTIMNLRISRVVSLAAQGGDSQRISRIFASSGMWLGVELFGTGDFPTTYNRTRR
jgi:DNA helicase-2/ATP-dependent DNA helicase PcrA